MKNTPRKYLDHRWGRGKSVPIHQSYKHKVLLRCQICPRMCCLATTPESWGIHSDQAQRFTWAASFALLLKVLLGKYKTPLSGQGQPTSAQQLQNKGCSETSTWMWQQLLVYKGTPLSSLSTQFSVFKLCLFTRSHAGWERKHKITLASSTIT